MLNKNSIYSYLYTKQLKNLLKFNTNLMSSTYNQKYNKKFNT